MLQVLGLKRRRQTQSHQTLELQRQMTELNGEKSELVLRLQYSATQLDEANLQNTAKISKVLNSFAKVCSGLIVREIIEPEKFI